MAVIILLPFLGTALGAAGVFFLKKGPADAWDQVLSGFAAGVMLAAAFWSLLQPAIQQAGSYFPAIVGLWAGFLLLMVLEKAVFRLKHGGSSSMLLLAIALHNAPEGIAVGIVAASWLQTGDASGFYGALALSAGIALQNIPEGAIVSMPLGSKGTGRLRAFGWGVLSGAIEPVAALLALALAAWIVPILPYFLGFAAGAMIYVVVRELIPEIHRGKGYWIGSVSFAAGFSAMMLLDGYFG